ncbi:transcriptional regulator [Sinorhizobium meliloti]|uniref:ParB N-terminal domain-containing protein n=1 Tax=Rhizobium meliloti TaxID=382 RepID=UPI000FD7FCB8|nr:ParB N-terminal domain-containing protein [Sinorhizobium meliloti]RVK81416.1 transcriptional regulator [Sinorhizobium meliloti]RVQ78038.1 transcriptional regulator [Sinorhizobium meliloti]
MAEFIRAKISDVHIGERARPIDEDHAQAIAASMAERGQISPIMVRRTPAANKGKTPLTLVAGGHRTRAALINGWEELDAIVVSADAVEAQLLELSENLFRNELSALDRAIFVAKFRELWEEQHGKINSKGGRPSKKQGHDGPDIFASGRELSDRVCDRLGISERTYKRVTSIAVKLHPALRTALRGTGGEDDQSLLLKLAKKGPSEQAAIARVLNEERDLKKAMAWLNGDAPKPDPQEAAFAKLVAVWQTASEDTRRRFLAHAGDQQDFSFLEAAE